ncbi:MAG TPA: NAD(P)H-dependent glycerol-3-phosphate dehydrogenase [Rhizomicrobium sp.]|jgi:glycerol-3-phosphate dehydrogenase (NAD(P)+)|nr:NAD(P)H-dependent glycerol-3-phosphate dehydrogenase [Rhizomicrobium sp.]
MTAEPFPHVAVLGAGAWGTALAAVASQAGRRVTLWGQDGDAMAALMRTHENRRYLPGIMLPEFAATGDLAMAAQADVLLLAMPAQAVRAFVRMLPRAGTPLVLCAKGIERSSGKLLTEVLAEAAPDAPHAILSGPSFAREVAQGLPTAVTIAARKTGARDLAACLQTSLSAPAFRPYASDDCVGVALGGAAKNVYAIACGVVEGLGLGENARAALLARSFAELARLGEQLGARSETLMGLSGLGDLVLSAASVSSRNFAFGLALGRGAAIATLRVPGQPLAEGVDTAPALVGRGKAGGVELPIAEAIADLLNGTLSTGEAVMRLMTRRLKSE